MKVLLSPLLQEGLEDFSIGVTEVPPHGEGTRHNHPGERRIEPAPRALCTRSQWRRTGTQPVRDFTGLHGRPR